MARTGPLTRNTSAVALGLAQIRIGNSADHIANAAAALAASDSIGALGQTAFSASIELWKMLSGFPQLEDLTIPTSETSSMECTFKELTAYNMALARGLDPNGAHSATIDEVSIASSLGTTTGTLAVTDTDGPVTDTFRVFFTGSSAGSIYGDATGQVTDFASLSSIIAPENPTSSNSPESPFFSIPANFFSGTWASGDVYVFQTTAYDDGTAFGIHSGEILLGAIKAPEFVRMEAVYTFPNAENTMTIIYPRCNVTSNMEVDLQVEDAAAPGITFEAKRADQDVSGGNSVWNAAPLGKIVFG